MLFSPFCSFNLNIRGCTVCNSFFGLEVGERWEEEGGEEGIHPARTEH